LWAGGRDRRRRGGLPTSRCGIGRVPADCLHAPRRLSRNLPGRAFRCTRLGLRRRTKIPLVHAGYYRISMKRSSRTWILLPALIILAAVAGLVVCNFQKEVGIAAPSKGGTAAVAAAAEAFDRSDGTGAAGYQAFNEALLVAVVARKNAPIMNPADTRLDNVLVRLIDCLSALREAWQSELDQTWDPETHGTAVYWNVLHPALEMRAGDTPTSTGLRGLSRARAAALLKEAVDLAG